MSITLTIKQEPGSARFPKRTIILTNCEESEYSNIVISRCSKTLRPSFDNAVFDSRVRNFMFYFVVELRVEIDNLSVCNQGSMQ